MYLLMKILNISDTARLNYSSLLYANPNIKKSVSVRKDEQSCFIGGQEWVKASKGESKVRAIVDRLVQKATCFGSSATAS